MTCVEAKILAAFSKMNPKDDTPRSIINEILHLGLSPIAEVVLHRSPLTPGMPYPRHPASWKDSNLNTAAKQIHKVKLAAESLQGDLQAMNAPAIYAFTKANFFSELLEKQLVATLKSAEVAIANVEEWKRKNPNWVNAKSGAPRKDVALRIAMILADEYFRATEKPPTISNHEVFINENQKGNKSYGPFLELVETVFKALDVKAKPEPMAKEARKRWSARNKIQDELADALKRSKDKSALKRTD